MQSFEEIEPGISFTSRGCIKRNFLPQRRRGAEKIQVEINSLPDGRQVFVPAYPASPAGGRQAGRRLCGEKTYSGQTQPLIFQNLQNFKKIIRFANQSP